MQTMAASPARQAASAFCRTSASVSPWSARRSEWPTMMALAPASASISAERSPVWAPEAFGWQSWAPTASFEPSALSAKPAIRVAGGQTSRSALPANAPAPRSWPRIHPKRISGRSFSSCRRSAAGWRRSCQLSRKCQRYRCASRGAPPVPDTGQAIPQAVNRFKWPTLPRLRGGRCHFMMRFQLGDALLRKSILNGSNFRRARPGSPSPAKTSWTHASRNSESLIKLARQDCHGHRDGRFDCQFRSLGHRRHLQGVRPVVARQDRQDRDFDRAIPPDLHRKAAAARPQFRPSADLGTGPRLRARPAGAATDHRRSRAR